MTTTHGGSGARGAAAGEAKARGAAAGEAEARAASSRRPSGARALARALLALPITLIACGGDDPSAPIVELDIGLDLVASGLTAPVALVELPDGTGRLLIADQVGRLRVVGADGQLRAEPFVDLTGRMVALNAGFDERGLLGVAAHPGFATNGRVFVYYSAPLRAGAPAGFNHTSRVSELTVGADPDRADPASERVVLEVDQPQANHNAGALAFGSDGYLYVALGDGGNANDTGPGHASGGNGQDIEQNLLGSILRIDVDGAQPYAIPPDNPLVGELGLDEIWAYGFRNPFRFSFDATTGDLLAGDVGQNRLEEVDVVVRGGNYGWNRREGFDCFDASSPSSPPAACATTGASGEPLLAPVLHYANVRAGGIGTAVIGGHVYRGASLPDLAGSYVFGDYSAGGAADGRLFVATPAATSPWSFQELALRTPSGRIGRFLLGIGSDAAGELYLLTSALTGPTGSTGRVERLVPVTATTD